MSRYHHHGRLPGYCPEPCLDPPDDGERTCPTCNETGEIPCPECEGKGCPECDYIGGDGPTGKTTCPDCEGCGFLYKGQATAQEEGAYEDAMEMQAELRREREDDKRRKG